MSVITLGVTDYLWEEMTKQNQTEKVEWFFLQEG